MTHSRLLLAAYPHHRKLEAALVSMRHQPEQAQLQVLRELPATQPGSATTQTTMARKQRLAAMFPRRHGLAPRQPLRRALQRPGHQGSAPGPGIRLGQLLRGSKSLPRRSLGIGQMPWRAACACSRSWRPDVHSKRRQLQHRPAAVDHAKQRGSSQKAAAASCCSAWPRPGHSFGPKSDRS